MYQNLEYWYHFRSYRSRPYLFDKVFPPVDWAYWADLPSSNLVTDFNFEFPEVGLMAKKIL